MNKVKVLVVDDVEAESIGLMLRHWDSDLIIETSSSAHDAMDLVDDAFDCLVVDYRMPGIDGITFVRRVRESSDVPIILYTGFGNESVAEEGVNAGATSYLRKKVDVEGYRELAEEIRKVSKTIRLRL